MLNFGLFLISEIIVQRSAITKHPTLPAGRQASTPNTIFDVIPPYRKEIAKFTSKISR
jgi:hypothetical protein